MLAVPVAWHNDCHTIKHSANFPMLVGTFMRTVDTVDVEAAIPPTEYE
jgi:hypothetical protein